MSDRAEAVPQGRLVAVDLQREMLLLARDRLDTRPNARFVQADAMRIPGPSWQYLARFLAT